jgi:hypothetical protein
MNKLLTLGLVAVLALFFSTSVLAQRGSEEYRKGYKGHKKQEHVAKRTSEKACPKCAPLRKEIAALKKRLAAVSKGKKKESHRRRSGHRSKGSRGHRGDRRGGKPDSKRGALSEKTGCCNSTKATATKKPTEERKDRIRTFLKKKHNKVI